jgi:anti-anti-sigma factor
MEMSVIELPGPVSCVRLNGRLDAGGADAIGTRFTASVAAVGRPAIVDLGQVSFASSMGIRLLIATARALNLKGGKMVLFGAQPLVQEVLDGVALDQIVPIVATEQQALEQLAA